MNIKSEACLLTLSATNHLHLPCEYDFWSALFILFGTLGWLLLDSVPRVLSDALHARDFEPAKSVRATGYKCANRNLVMFDRCVVTYRSTLNPASRQIADWRFGRDPRQPTHLLQRPDDPPSATTDLSLQTLWNRAAFATAVLPTCLFATLVKSRNARERA